MSAEDARQRYVDPRALLEDGTVLLINLSVLWPRGLALTVDMPKEGDGEATLHVQDFGEYMAGFIDNDENNEILQKRMFALRDAELRREAKATGHDVGCPVCEGYRLTSE